MPNNIKSYPAETILACDECMEHCRLPHDVHASDTPLIVKCPACNNSMLWRTLPALPKVRSSQSDFKYCEISKENSAAQEPELKEDDTPPIPFYQLANDLGENINIIAQQIEMMQKEIENFAKQVIPYFQSAYKHAKAFKENYKREYVGDFLKNPVTAVPIHCEDALAARYAHWIISPKFYNANLGVNIRSKGGMRIELMNQYTRMNNTNMDYRLCESLGLPASLDLKVKDNKITGGSLPSCWKDIPGIAEDRDSNEEWRSVFITDHYRACQWLARHGIPAWEPKPFVIENLNSRRLDEEIASIPMFVRAWKKLLSHSRIGIFWSNVRDSRMFAVNVALLIRGLVAVFVGEQKDVNAWKNIYVGEHLHREMVFCMNGDPIQWEAVMRTRMVIVDMNSEIDSEVLTRLYGYKGKVLIISHDPFMDFRDENIVASLVYGLINHSIHDFVTWEKWDSCLLKDVDEAIFNSLVDLQDKRIKKLKMNSYTK